jgi:pyruvate kinase
MEPLRRTKLVCTLGPASFDEDLLETLIRRGLDVARLNFSHGTHDDHRRIYERIRSLETKVSRPVAVLQDLQGPKIRLGKLARPVELVPGDVVVLSAKADFTGDDRRFPTTYPALATDVKASDPVLLADGRLEVRVVDVDDTEVRAEVVQGGTLSSNKGINLPGTRISAPSLTAKDLEDLRFGLELGVDFVALSFVRTAADVRALRSQMERLGRSVPVISKIEKPEAVENLEAIVKESDGIMVARGDLGVELPPEQVPGVQRRALRWARNHAKVSIVATQMLMSMTEHPRPTHAEVSDVANAVFEGADAVMLSDETASGQFPVRAVETMVALVRGAESAPTEREPPSFAEEVAGSTAHAISRAAVVTAESTGAVAIVSYTQFGLGPRLMAAWRPACAIFGCATTAAEVRRLALFWGVEPLCIPRPDSVESLVDAVERTALDRELLQPADTVVITSKMPFEASEMTNMLKVHHIVARGGERQ